ncbi:MAG: hypothetical protein ACE14P_04685 [Methanotrichaceae archaeon]
MKSLQIAGLILALSLLAILPDLALGKSAQSDLKIEKIASDAYVLPMTDSFWNSALQIAEVKPSQKFYYIIKVTNLLPSSAENIIVEDWLPGEVTNATIIEPYEDVLASGSLARVTFPYIGPLSTKYIVIQVDSPHIAPTTLYNYVILLCDNDLNSSDNVEKIATYVLPYSYVKRDAVSSYEDLLRRQSHLYMSFAELLNKIPKGREENYTFIVSFEQLLRTQSDLFSNFNDLLSDSTTCNWSKEMTPEDQVNFLNSYEDLLRREANLFASFEQKLKGSWQAFGGDYCYDPDGPGAVPQHTETAQRELLASLEDLLRRQEQLYGGFQKLEASLDIRVSHEDRVKFLSSFEDLLRRESQLLLDFEYLIKMNFKSTETDSLDYVATESDSIPPCQWCSG